MHFKKSLPERSVDFLIYLFLIVLSIVTLYPIWHVLVASFSDGNLLMQHRGMLFWPKGYSLESYRLVLSNNSIITGYTNTIFIVIVGTALNLVLTTMGAYVLSRRGFLWRTPAMMLVLFTMFFTGGMIPTFLLVEKLGLLDSKLALILPSAINTYNLVIMRTSFAAVPESLEESAKLEGANDFTILLRIFVPVSGAVIAVMVLYYATAHWNSWFPALLYMRTRSNYPLQLILREILIMNSLETMRDNIDIEDMSRVSETIKYTTIVVATVPILLLYPFLQKYFVKGVMIGAVKG
ncbi:carbohydrate ABC transporter permease [Eubacteriales bacterium OttesenSCG-928-A19]|nr:carbohydrate ABC transporter permease [Eubacteriales bacterium OttesenSCG-928-A19]